MQKYPPEAAIKPPWPNKLTIVNALQLSARSVSLREKNPVRETSPMAIASVTVAVMEIHRPPLRQRILLLSTSLNENKHRKKAEWSQTEQISPTKVAESSPSTVRAVRTAKAIHTSPVPRLSLAERHQHGTHSVSRYGRKKSRSTHGTCTQGSPGLVGHTDNQIVRRQHAHIASSLR